MRGMSRARKAAAILLAVAALALVFGPMFPDAAFARAGGGERFPSGGGGGDSGGGSSGGGGGSWDGGGGGGGGGEGVLFDMILWLIIRSPIPWPVKIGLIVVIIIAFSRSKRKGRIAARGGSFPAPAYSPPAMPAPVYNPTPPPAADLLAGLNGLKQRDPAFSEQAFEDMAATAFHKIQEAWSSKNLAIARAFTSPSLLQRFETQIQELKKNGRTNHIEDLTIGSVEIVEASGDGANDYITARIRAAAIDYTVEDKTGNIIYGGKQMKPFTEYWTFMRSQNTKTRAGEELEAKHCPNCGAPISINATGKCDYCDSVITSGQFTWVLSEISQESAWKPRAQAVRPPQVSPLAGGRYVIGLVQCPSCGANVQDILGVTDEKCWRCGATVTTGK